MAQRRKRFDKQFKIPDAKVILSGEMIVKDISEELHIKDSTLRRWASEYEEMGEPSPATETPRSIRITRSSISRRRQKARDREPNIKYSNLLESRPRVKFEFLKTHRGEIDPIKKACRLLRMSNSGFGVSKIAGTTLGTHLSKGTGIIRNGLNKNTFAHRKFLIQYSIKGCESFFEKIE